MLSGRTGRIQAAHAPSFFLIYTDVYGYNNLSVALGVHLGSKLLGSIFLPQFQIHTRYIGVCMIYMEAMRLLVPLAIA